MIPGEVRHFYYPPKLSEVVKEWINKEYPTLLSAHLKALVVIDDRYTNLVPGAVCACGARVPGTIFALRAGAAMNRHVAEVIAEHIEFEEKEKAKAMQREEFRRAWTRKQLKRRRFAEDVGRVSGRGRPR